MHRFPLLIWEFPRKPTVIGWVFFCRFFFFVACPEESRVTPQKRSAVWIDQCVHQKYYAPREEKLGDALEDGGNGSQRADISVEQCQKDL